MDQDRLERENVYVLTAVQALLGLISSAVEAVAIQVGDDESVLRFWVHGDPAEVAEDAEDAVGDMVAFLLPDEDPLIKFEIIEGSPPPDVYEWAGRMVYRAKR